MKLCACGNSIGKGMKGNRCRVCIWNRFQDAVINKIDATGAIVGTINCNDTQPKKRGSNRMITQPESAPVVTSVEPKKLTKHQTRKARGLARTYLRNLAKAKKLFEKADNALDALVGFVGPGVTIEVPDRKSKVTTFDNFEGKNSAYRPAKVRKIDVKVDDIA